MSDRLRFEDVVNLLIKRQDMESVSREHIVKTLENLGELFIEHDGMQIAWVIRLKAVNLASGAIRANNKKLNAGLPVKGSNHEI